MVLGDRVEIESERVVWRRVEGCRGVGNYCGVWRGDCVGESVGEARQCG